MGRYVTEPHIPPAIRTSWPHTALAVLVMVLMVAAQLDANRWLPSRASVARIYSYAGQAEEQIAGHYMITGRWIQELPGVLDEVEGAGRLLHVAQGRWPPQAEPHSSYGAAVVGTVLTSQGSFLLTTNARNPLADELESLAFFHVDSRSAWPLFFEWSCGHAPDGYGGGLPDPTDIDPLALPSACRPR